MYELVNRPATPPPFPASPSDRPTTKYYRWWLLPSVLGFLLVLSMVAHVCLSIFFSREKSLSIGLVLAKSQLELQLPDLAVTTTTSTQHHTAELTRTSNHAIQETITWTRITDSIQPSETPFSGIAIVSADPRTSGSFRRYTRWWRRSGIVLALRMVKKRFFSR